MNEWVGRSVSQSVLFFFKVTTFQHTKANCPWAWPPAALVAHPDARPTVD